MSDLVRDASLGASSGLAGVAPRRRRRALPLWLRLVVVLGVAVGLWAAIFLTLSSLFAR